MTASILNKPGPHRAQKAISHFKSIFESINALGMDDKISHWRCPGCSQFRPIVRSNKSPFRSSAIKNSLFEWAQRNVRIVRLAHKFDLDRNVTGARACVCAEPQFEFETVDGGVWALAGCGRAENESFIKIYNWKYLRS